jgi:hypothetical protein
MQYKPLQRLKIMNPGKPQNRTLTTIQITVPALSLHTPIQVEYNHEGYGSRTCQHTDLDEPVSVTGQLPFPAFGFSDQQHPILTPGF